MKGKLLTILLLFSILLTFNSCSENQKPVELSNDIKAIYLTPEYGGQLSRNELKKHPQIIVINNFDSMKSAIDKVENSIGIWIDKSAVNIVDKKWLLKEPQKHYPLLLIGCYDIESPKPMRESFYSDSIDWNSKTLQKGFSFWVLLKASKNSTGMQEYEEGIDSILTIDEMLRVTNERIKE